MQAERKEAVKAGDWARGEATDTKGKLAVAEQRLQESRTELERLREENEQLLGEMKTQLEAFANYPTPPESEE